MYLINDDNHGAVEANASCMNITGKTDMLALNWLEGHMRIMEFWLERLVSENGDAGLIDTLHRQRQWLQHMTDKLHRAD